MQTPEPRGTLSTAVLSCLHETDPDTTALAGLAPDDSGDAAITLWSLHALHYTGFDDVADDLEWHPGLLAVRARLERDLEAELRSRHPGHDQPAGDLPELPDELFAFIADHDGPSLATYVQRTASRVQVEHLLRVRSLYHLMESDPTAWVVPRLGVRAKAALMELQYDEYGAGDPNRLHSHLFARGLAASGLDPTPGSYVDEAPTEVLEQNNAMTMFGLHRRLRGAALGHLAAFEATSSLPSRRMAQGLQRLDFPDELVDYYLEHVEADAVHEQLAVRTVCGALVADHPELVDDVFLGAFTCLDLESRVAARLLRSWEEAAA